jgi:two-component system sensor histidine kinase SenX3
VTAIVVGVVVVAACLLAALALVVRASGHRRSQAALAARLSELMSRLPSGVAAHPASGRSSATQPPLRSPAGIGAALAEAERIIVEELRVRRQALVASDRLSAALSVVPHGVIVCDDAGEICYRNEAGSAFAGARHGDVLAEVAVNDLLALALGGSPAEQTLELYGPPRRSLLITARPLHGADDTLVGAVAIIEDVSERRRLDSVRRDFVANVSHELKTPVGALGVLAETMQAEDDPVVSRRLAQRMHLEAFRVARIIDDLLDLSRIESEEAPVREPVPVHLVVAEAVERIRALADHRHITIQAGEAPKRLTIVGDRRQLVSALHNLLENAVKYSDDNSSVEVDVRAVPGPASAGTVIEVGVSDHGIGIPARDLERIFERFYRVDRARSRETGGTGLGLAIVRHVATNHRGEVTVTSLEGEGSTFTLRLPAGPGPVAVSTRKPHSEVG